MKHTFPINELPTSFPIFASTGNVLGYVDDLIKLPDTITVSGWSVADEVGILSGRLRVSTAPTIPREDVVDVHPGLITRERGNRLGFELEANANGGITYLFLRIGQEAHYIFIGE